VPHGIIVDWGCIGAPGAATCAISTGLNALTGAAQGDMAAFLSSDTVPPPVRP
jgi:hypothetical protein